MNYFVEKSGQDPISDKYKSYLAKKARMLNVNLTAKWEKCHRKLSVFQTKFCDWLSSETTIERQITTEISFLELPVVSTSAEKNASLTGRPPLDFSEKSERSKRRQAANLSMSENNQTNLLVTAASMSARKEGQVDLAVVLKETIESPSRPSKIRKLCHQDIKSPISMSEEEALAFILENDFSKRQYCNIRLESKRRNSDIYPSYNKVLAVKNKCRPNGVIVDDKCAKVPLQMLLTHTTKRILEMQKDVLATIANSHISTEMIFSYGFDSSSGQSQYKQAFLDPCTSRNADSCLFATTVIPLRLLTSTGILIWNNRSPQSTRFCRPLKLEFTKETKEVIIKEADDLKEQILELEKLQFEIDAGKIIEVTFKMSLTVIDGKVLNVLTNTSSYQKCPICHCTQSDILEITDYNSEKFRPIEDNLKYGISPLHCWIRFFEFILHLGYKLEIKKWQIRSDEDKNAVKKRKEKIQNDFWKELSLRVDIPKPGGCGTTNDGNTSRRAFMEYEQFSKILGVDMELIFRLRIILISLSCQFPLNFDKFEKYCFETGQYYQNMYPWR